MYVSMCMCVRVCMCLCLCLCVCVSVSMCMRVYVILCEKITLFLYSIVFYLYTCVRYGCAYARVCVRVRLVRVIACARMGVSVYVCTTILPLVSTLNTVIRRREIPTIDLIVSLCWTCWHGGYGSAEMYVQAFNFETGICIA